MHFVHSELEEGRPRQGISCWILLTFILSMNSSVIINAIFIGDNFNKIIELMHAHPLTLDQRRQAAALMRQTMKAQLT